jgi:hypothetical protein
MVKRPTWILLATLALVVAAYFLIKNQPSKSTTLTPTATGANYLITQAYGVLQSLQISDSKGNHFQMQRDLSKSWVITEPTSGAADQGLAGAAETQISALSIVTTLSSPPALNTIGLAIPACTIDLRFINGTSHKIEVGNLTPTASGYYVRFDNGKIFVIAQSGIDSVLNLLTSPPFPATATPVATSDTSSTPTP